ncbi:dehydrogenase [Nocardia sp. ET3-3]|uniref:Dehydrogenase n=1 Tax=Nocardia terrae TaxID=2675851 RepID=A0A7K1V8B2_9NOCA|nr:nitroreductase family protein [Nocardia terrae]MVU82900.1 dehydrogenase [Nocardia terrae]
MTQMSVADAIRTRRTVRHYLPDPVAAQDIDTLTELAMEAPSSWNLQDRSVVVVTDPAVREGLVWATGGQPQPQEAPVTLVFVAEPHAWKNDRTDIFDLARRNHAWNDEFIAGFAAASTEFQQGLAERDLLREYAVKDAMIAATYVMLAATELGLATSPMNGWDEAKVKKVIGIADRDDLAIALLVSVGHPAETRRHPGRRASDRNVFRDTFAGPRPESGN